MVVLCLLLLSLLLYLYYTLILKSEYVEFLYLDVYNFTLFTSNSQVYKEGDIIISSEGSPERLIREIHIGSWVYIGEL